MTLEVIKLKGWPQTRVAARLRKQHREIPALSLYRQAIASIPLLGIGVLPITHPEVETATQLSQQYELLTGDALIVAVMRQHGLSRTSNILSQKCRTFRVFSHTPLKELLSFYLTNLASADDDFDRVPGITRYAPL